MSGRQMLERDPMGKYKGPWTELSLVAALDVGRTESMRDGSEKVRVYKVRIFTSVHHLVTYGTGALESIWGSGKTIRDAVADAETKHADAEHEDK